MKRYKRLSVVEREEISRCLALKNSCQQIAIILKRSTSTITREIKRSKKTRTKYRAVFAHKRAQQILQKSRRYRKLCINSQLREFVLNHLQKRWSPEQIAKKLKILYPEDMNMQVSHETIYAYVYVHPRGMIKRRLVKQLRRKHMNRQAREAILLKQFLN